jgi:hypothetical protein
LDGFRRVLEPAIVVVVAFASLANAAQWNGAAQAARLTAQGAKAQYGAPDRYCLCCVA